MRPLLFCIWPLKIYLFWHFLYDQIFDMLTLPVIFDGEGPDMKKQVKQIVMTALFMALCCTATMVIHVPSPTQGFVNLGDCMVLLSGWLLGPWYGMAAAGVGSAMADVLLSYAHYAPGTLVIKGAMGLLCGLMTAKEYCDCAISLDADLQDDVDALDKFVEKFLEGCDVVYGVRSARDTDTFFKKFTAEGFYKLINLMGGEVVFNHADYRLVSSRVLQEFANFKEVNLFLRGMFPLVGFKSSSVYYERNKRMAGESHYPLSKMLGLAFDGITSLSIKPIHLITGMGITFSALSFLGIMWIIIARILGNTVIGWASTTCLVCFMGGVQLICLGVLGEYIGKIYMEVKQRPRYIISERTWESDKE